MSPKKRNPTVRELNKELDSLIRDLLEKHGKVSNPDFEKELSEITGIGYKQLKNYKNHPKPDSEIKDNAKVLGFARDKCQIESVSSKKRIILIVSLILVCLFLVGTWFAYDHWERRDIIIPIEGEQINKSKVSISESPFKKNRTVQSNKTSLYFEFKKDDLLLTLGRISNDFPKDKFICRNHFEFETCILPMRYKVSSTTISLTIRSGFIDTIILITTNHDDIRMLGKQLDERILKDHKKQNNFGNDARFGNEYADLFVERRPTYLKVKLLLRK